jgi:hypothetical protein
LIISGAVYVFGALGFELFESYFDVRYGGRNWYSLSIQTLQELLEMIGIIILIYALLDYISFQYKNILFTTGSK